MKQDTGEPGAREGTQEEPGDDTFFLELQYEAVTLLHALP